MKALVFGGQGSLVTGLGQDIYEAYPEIRHHYDDTILKREIRDFVFNETELNTKLYAQLGLLQFYIAMTDLLKIKDISHELSFGLSLGTYGALYAAEIMEEDALFDLVLKRSEIMNEVATKQATGLIALLGVEVEEVERYLLEANQNDMTLYLANDNATGQVVVGGLLADLENFKNELSNKGKKAIMLPVSAAFHTPYMREAEERFSEVLKDYTFSSLKKTIIDNRTATKMDETLITKALSEHLTKPVKFRESLIYAKDLGVTEFIVIDAGKTIEGFIKKTLGKEVKITTINNVSSFERMI